MSALRTFYLFRFNLLFKPRPSFYSLFVSGLLVPQAADLFGSELFVRGPIVDIQGEVALKYLRLFADENGESHVEQLSVEYNPVDYAPPAPPFGISERTAVTGSIHVNFPAGWTSELHPTPRRQLFVLLAGSFSGRASDNTVMSLAAGDVVLMEDTVGKGHTAEVIGDEDVHAMMIHLE